MKKSTFLKSLFVLVLLFAVLACGVIGTPAPTPDTLGTIVAETLTSMPVLPTQAESTPVPVTFTPIPAPASSTPEAVGTWYVYTQAQNVNLRVNPGRLFKVSRVLAQGTRLKLLGFAPGRQWLNVVNDEGIIGWVGIDFVTGGSDGPQPPVVDPKDVLVVTGTVLDVKRKSRQRYWICHHSRQSARRCQHGRNRNVPCLPAHEIFWHMGCEFCLGGLHQQHNGFELQLPWRYMRKARPGNGFDHIANIRVVEFCVEVASS